MKRISLLISSFFLLGNLLFSQSANIEFVEYDLENGMHVILHQDNTTPIVVISVLYHVGSKNEDPVRTGFAHFFEHLMFEGSKNIERGQIDKMVTGVGGYLNAFTSKDQTYYFMQLPSNYLEMGLWIESERLLHAKINTEAVETQREVVKEERRQRLDNQPYGSVLEELYKRAFTTHPYRWQPIGSAQYIDQASLEEFMDFYKTFYVPQNATLTITGDIDVETSKAMISKYFKDIPKGTQAIPRPTIVEPPLGKEVRDTIFDNIQLPGVIMGYRTPAQDSDDAYALEMLSTLLSDGESSRLYKKLVDEEEKALQVFAFPLSSEDPGVTLMFAIASGGTAAHEMEASINAEIKKVQDELVGEREFQKLLNKVENDFVSSKGSLSGLAQSLPESYVFYGNTNLINTELDRYRKVTREDLQRVAKEYLVRDNRVILYYLPKEN